MKKNMRKVSKYFLLFSFCLSSLLLVSKGIKQKAKKQADEDVFLYIDVYNEFFLSLLAVVKEMKVKLNNDSSINTEFCSKFYGQKMRGILQKEDIVKKMKKVQCGEIPEKIFIEFNIFFLGKLREYETTLDAIKNRNPKEFLSITEKFIYEAFDPNVLKRFLNKYYNF